jgi:2-amino-4-hydroxy-6-hydroxymethyldihydropteridine diphosphokinase
MSASKSSGEGMAEVGLGLGANLGDRAGAFIAALAALETHTGIRLKLLSPVYHSTPWGLTDQPDFLNMAALISADIHPPVLLSIVKRIESGLGRTPGLRWGPRPIDLDILYVDGLESGDEALRLPHPGLFVRSFVIRPLLDMLPQDHALTARLETARARLPDDGLRRDDEASVRLQAAFPSLYP